MNDNAQSSIIQSVAPVEASGEDRLCTRLPVEIISLRDVSEVAPLQEQQRAASPLPEPELQAPEQMA
jgi:hypothetical protein